MDDLRKGLSASAALVVTDAMLVPALADYGFPTWAGMPSVFATVMMIGLMEEACVKLAHPRLPDGRITLGTAVNVKHLAPTPIGREVVATAELVEVEGPRLSFQVTCTDGDHEIGAGTHQRVIVDRQNFERRLAANTSR